MDSTRRDDTSFHLEDASIPLHALPSGTYLAHATNCIATWGGGIAAELAQIFPTACNIYKDFCRQAKSSPSDRWPDRARLAGRCLIIPPQREDVARGAPEISVVCLFTSYGFGQGNRATGKPGRDTPTEILEQTRTSLKRFREQLETLHRANVNEVVIYSPLFNSGAFRVPWNRTADLIRAEFKGWDGRWVVLAPPE